MTIVDLLQADPEAEDAARRQYDRAAEKHFAEAHRLVVQGRPEAAEFEARAGAEVRTLAYFELKT